MANDEQADNQSSTLEPIKSAGQELAKKGIAAVSKALAGAAAVDVEPVSKVVLAVAAVASKIGKFLYDKLLFPLLKKLKDNPLGLLMIAGGAGILALLAAGTVIAPVLMVIMMVVGVPAVILLLAGLLSGTLGGSATLNGVAKTATNLINIPTNLAPIAQAAEIGVGGTIVSVGAVSLITVTVMAAAFYIPSVSRPGPTEEMSQYIEVSKMISFEGKDNPDKIENNQITNDSEIKYKVLITAKGADLKNLKLNDIITSSQDTTYTVNPTITGVPDFLANGQSITVEYSIKTNPTTKFTDAVVSNIAIAEAIAEITDNIGQKKEVINQKAWDQTSLIIGSPKMSCPSGWPVKGNPQVTQDPREHGYQAIDLGGNNMQVYSTFNGSVLDTGQDPEGGWYVRLTGFCNGTEFRVIFYHLKYDSTLVKAGDKISIGDPVAISNNSGSNTTGAHLHYELWSEGYKLKINDYIPRY